MELDKQINHMEQSLIKYERTHPDLRREDENAYIPMIKAILASLERLKEIEDVKDLVNRMSKTNRSSNNP